ncbi:RidA family protein [Candidatus Aerophobetes bacterium]|nr:RidA family protein [Candidatus Aerophobetes bacterium]
MLGYEEKLKELGITLPEVPSPAAAYIPAKKVGNLVFCSGQGPSVEGKLVYVGKVGAEKTLKEGYEAAKICALNCLAAVKNLVGGLDKIEEIVQVRGFVNCTADFEKQPEVINGASELLEKIFGDKGKHARCALGTSSLPRNITCELEMVVKVKD